MKYILFSILNISFEIHGDNSKTAPFHSHLKYMQFSILNIPFKIHDDDSK